MKLLLPFSMLLALAAAGAAAWLLPTRQAMAARPAVKLDASGNAVTVQPLSVMSPKEKEACDALDVRLTALETRLEAHEAEMRDSWDALMADVARENAVRKHEAERIASVVKASGLKPVEAQVEDEMDETMRRRVKSMMHMYITEQVASLKSNLALAPQQSASLDQMMTDILAEEEARIDADEPSNNMWGWRGDIWKESRQKLQERLDPLLTSDQKVKAGEYFAKNDWNRWDPPKEDGK